MELTFNIFLALILIVFYGVSTTFGGMTISTDIIGPQGFPQMIIVVSIVLLVINTVSIVKKTKNGNKKEKKERNDEGVKAMLSCIALFAAYIFTMNYLGFLISTFVFSIVTIWALGYREKVKGIAFVIILTLVITLVFGKVFFVSLPRGIGILRELSYFIY